MEKPVPRRLLLKLLGSRSGIKMDAASAVRVGALFGITENNMRVTLTRLQAAKLLNLIDRGFYTLGQQGQTLAKEVGAWRSVEQQVGPWQGEWVGVLTHTQAKRNRKAQRVTARALKMLGMQAITNDFYLRPNNFSAGVGYVRTHLHSLGVDISAPVFKVAQFDSDMEDKARNLWPVKELEARYQQGILDIEQALDRLPELSLEDAAKESYLVGDSALQQLVFDPLLPAPLINESLRQAFRAKVQEYDQIGERIWLQFLHESR
ncbi:PaaX family transcriptional regulator C-terminal domain-containing protein [Paraglaciecola chathamensis]|uniref:PaaX family transcriptional regulator C-terminal domain-containing protein n=1 Tax=Paraglaciecola chathamensis TaxID=368405 RepID=UPI00270549AF|nr:PaaX family transcriptional regulator C-terminal domain-containing protein [Paraglaciecola chathamensis]MDO6561070.1 PaaX family transcriptional regulator C-terminal domain-containing protein [Paraglaciecola chathamensis]